MGLRAVQQGIGDQQAAGPMSTGAMNGNIVLRHRQVFTELFGASLVGDALGDLGKPERTDIMTASPTAWIPIESVEAFYEVVAHRTGRDPVRLHLEVGRVVIERNLRTIWRLVLRLTSNAQLIAQAPIVYSHTWNRGILSARMVGTNDAIADISAWPEIPDFTIRGVGIGLELALVLTGRSDVQVEWARTPEGVRYRIRWS